MSKKSLYDLYLESLTSEHLKEVTASIHHQEDIIRFGKAMAQFNVRPIVSVLFGHELSLAAACMDNREAGVITSQLLDAGYNVDAPEQSLIYPDGRTSWRAKVRGHDIEFKLIFELPSAIAA